MLQTKHNRLTDDELMVVEQTKDSYLDNEWPSVKLNYNPWNYSRAENHGIVLGIFEAMHVMAVLELTPTEILEFNLDIEALYNNVPYHSFNHAIDVVVKLYYVLSDLQAASYLASYDIASLLISGLCHDCGHPGLNNLFQKNSNSELAQRYPDAILERYSIDLTLQNISKHQLFRNLEYLRDPMYSDSTTTEVDVASRMRYSIRTAILNTDMTRHFAVVEECKVIVSVLSKKARRMSVHGAYKKECNSEGPSSPRSPQVPSPTPSALESSSLLPSKSTLLRDRSPSEPVRPKKLSLFAYSLTGTKTCTSAQRKNGYDSNGSSDNDEEKLKRRKANSPRRMQVRRSISMYDALLDSTQRQSLINILLHAVDVFNPVLPWDMCKKWSDLMNIESFRQGELEKQLGLPISPNMDQETTDQRQVSLDFGTIIIRPFFVELVSLFPVDDQLLPALESNLDKWSRLSLEESRKDINVPKGANSHMYSWSSDVVKTTTASTSPSTLAISRHHQASVELDTTGGRRLSVAAGTVDIPNSRLEMIRRHSHEGFEALHRRMVGRLFSKHLEKIHERRKISYTSKFLTSMRQQQQPPTPLRTSNSDIITADSTNNNSGRGGNGSGGMRVWNPFNASMLSPVRESISGEHNTTPTTNSESPLPPSAGDTTTTSASSAQSQPTRLIIPVHNNQLLYSPNTIATALPQCGGGSDDGPSMEAQLYSYRIDSVHCSTNSTPPQPPSILESSRSQRSVSLDPTILLHMPSSYSSLTTQNQPENF